MTPDATVTTTVKANPITKTVFDLSLFDDVKLSKPFTPPAKPATLEEATLAAGNDLQKLLNLVHEGLIAEARQSAYDDNHGFMVVSEDGVDVPYAGIAADEESGKVINAAILGVAKMQAGGNWASWTPDQKKAAKAKATDFFRSNPAMLAGLQAAGSSVPVV